MALDTEQIDRALARRAPLAPRTGGLRLIHAKADDLPGLVVERHGTALLLRHAAHLEPERETLADLLTDRLEDIRTVHAQLMRRSAEELRPALLLRGEPLATDAWAREQDLRYRVILGRGAGTGIFLDMREHRQAFARECAGGRSVLNLFSYTGLISVAARLAGASEILSVDAHRPYLDVYRENLALNGIDPKAGDTPAYQDDVMQVTARLVRRNKRFDAIFCDPPTRGRMAGARPFSEKRDYEELMARVLNLLAPEGVAYFASHALDVSPAGFRQRILRASRDAAVSVDLEERKPPLPLDFPWRGARWRT